ncbi:uncharacterized protein LOC110963529 isoform X2 [Acanthochromis polyacanthus]|uniref:uncharacterized protein LOC110963529 isoform X2 n=1 Tax=Acanthochromis polyacanthus TaxID=80966 RepID=UPI0022348A21|nr:uncharacterized protein LOC110963529 isoform X2 [Acanthochromis polyacanthus]
MSALLGEIARIDQEAASILEDAKFSTDSDLQFLSRDDLRELFPGNRELKRRKTIFDIIHKQKPVDLLLEGLREFIPLESLRAALTDNGVLVDYLHVLKNMKTQMDNVQTFLDAHINLLEDISKPGRNQELQNGSKSATSATTDPMEISNNQHHDRQGAYGSPVRPRVSGEVVHYLPQTVKYQVVVSGQTFGAHVQLIDNIKSPSLNRRLQLVESTQDPQIIFVFCPIVSRLATDANAALEEVKGQESIILVLMHHVHEVKSVTHLRTWEDNQNVVLYVHVFYHEKVRGLLKRPENKDAVCQIQRKLLEMHPCKYINANAQDESSMTRRLPHGGDNSGSQNDGDKNSDSKPSLLQRLFA